MYNSENSEEVNKKSNQNGYVNENHEKFDFGRCQVCKDKATGIHYGIPSCEGCKGFYKRSVDKYHKYVCYFGYKCSVTPRLRRRCRLCRWKQCVEAGMSFDAIKMGRISKAQKEKLRVLIKHIKVKSIIEKDIQSDANINAKSSKVAKLLNPVQIRLAKEIQEKCYHAYIEFSRDIIDTYKCALNFISINKLEPLHPDIIDQETFQLIWPKFLNKMSENTKQIVLYIKSLPGISQLDINDLATLFDKHTRRLFRLKITRSFIGGELFFMITENIRITRGFLARLVGVATQERIFKFHERINNLGVSDREMSLLMPTIITYTTNVSGLKYPNQISELHELYKQALFDEFNSNNRSEEFIKELIEVLAVL